MKHLRILALLLVAFIVGLAGFSSYTAQEKTRHVLRFAVN